MWKKWLVPGLVMACLGVLSNGTATAGGTPGQKCAAAKRKAAGKKLAAKLGCYAKAKSKAPFSVDPACLTKAEGKFSAAFAKAGAACPGTTAAIEALVDNCVNTLAGDVPGNTKCTSASVKSVGKTGGAELGCAAKDVTKPGTEPGCSAGNDTKLTAALAKAGNCTAVSTLPDLHDCRDTIVAALPSSVPTTTTTSTSTTSTTGPPVCGNGITEVGETCDDHNTVDESDAAVPIIPTDNCPKNCVIGSCSAGAQTAQTVAVNFATLPGSPQLFGLTIFVNYPDAKADLPGSGSGVGGSITNVNPGALNQPNDLDYGLLDGLVSLSGLTGSKLFDLTLQRCPALPPLAAGDFTCLVKDASDQGGSTVAGVTCTVVP
jgi:hypothetical protein